MLAPQLAVRCKPCWVAIACEEVCVWESQCLQLKRATKFGIQNGFPWCGSRNGLGRLFHRQP